MQTAKQKQDLWSGMALIGLALMLYLYLIPTWVGDNTFGGMSPQFFPRFGTILIGLGGTILTVGALVKLRKKDPPEQSDTVTGNTDLLKIGLIAAAMVGFILLFQSMGYLYAGPPFTAAMMVLFGARSPLSIVLVSAIATVALFFVFSYGLNLPLT